MHDVSSCSLPAVHCTLMYAADVDYVVFLQGFSLTRFPSTCDPRAPETKNTPLVGVDHSTNLISRTFTISLL